MRYPKLSHFHAQGMQSNIELKLAEYLESLHVKVVHDRHLGRKDIDLFLPQYKIGIEINGIRFHATDYNAPLRGSSFKSKDYHYLKTIDALKEGILLYHFWDFEHLAKIKDSIVRLLDGDILSDRSVDKNPMLVGLAHLEPRYYIAKDVSLYHKGSIFDSKPMIWRTSHHSVYEFYTAGYVTL